MSTSIVQTDGTGGIEGWPPVRDAQHDDARRQLFIAVVRESIAEAGDSGLTFAAILDRAQEAVTRFDAVCGPFG